MREKDFLFVLDVLGEQRGDFVPKEALVVSPEMALDLDVTVRVQLLVPHQHPQVLVLDVAHVLQHRHNDRPQLLDLNHREALDQQLLQFLVLCLPFHLVHQSNLVGELVPKR